MIERIKANETSALIESEMSNSSDDRKLFVHNLGELLSQTREGIVSCELGDDEIVTVDYGNGNHLKVNVEADSYIAIVRDVCRRL